MIELFEKYHNKLSDFVDGVLVNNRYLRGVDKSEATGIACDAIIMAIDAEKFDITYDELKSYARKILKGEAENSTKYRINANGFISDGRNYSDEGITDLRAVAGSSSFAEKVFKKNTVETIRYCKKCQEPKMMDEFRIDGSGMRKYTRTICKKCEGKLGAKRQKARGGTGLTDNYIRKKIFDSRIRRGDFIGHITQEEMDKRRKLIQNRRDERMILGHRISPTKGTTILNENYFSIIRLYRHPMKRQDIARLLNIPVHIVKYWIDKYNNGIKSMENNCVINPC